MSSLFKKLNTLIKAGVNDVLSEVQDTAESLPRKRIPRERLGNDIDNEVEQLRGQINRALSYEDDLTEKIQQVNEEINELDRQADEAVAADDKVNAHYYVERLQRAKQRQAMLTADLDEHRVVTQELITRVNELDATISEARYRQSQAEIATPDAPEEVQPSAATPNERQESDNLPEGVRRARELSQQTGRALSDVLREARERVEQMGELADAQRDVQASTQPASEQAVAAIEQSVIEDDIAARRSRLSAPPKKKPSSTDKQDDA